MSKCVVLVMFALIVMSGISYGDDACAKVRQRDYYKYGATKSSIDGGKGSKSVYRAALKYAEDELDKYKHLKERASNGSEYDSYKRGCECIEGAIKLIKKTSYADMWKMISD